LGSVIEAALACHPERSEGSRLDMLAAESARRPFAAPRVTSWVHPVLSAMFIFASLQNSAHFWWFIKQADNKDKTNGYHFIIVSTIAKNHY
jgi:hypothetical protein